MTVAFVQGAQNTGSGGSITTSYGSATTAGNTLFAYLEVGNNAGSVAGVTLGMPSGWTAIGPQIFNPTSDTSGQLFVYPNNPGGITSVLGTSSVSTGIQLLLMELSGIPSAATVDAEGDASGNSSTMSATTTTGLSQSGEVVIGAGGCSTGAGIVTNDPAATNTQKESSAFIGQNICSFLQWFVAGSSSAQTIAPTLNSTFNYCAVVVTIETSSGPSPVSAAMPLSAGAASLAIAGSQPTGVSAAVAMAAGAAQLPSTGGQVASGGLLLAAGPAALAGDGEPQPAGGMSLHAGAAALTVTAEAPAAGAMALAAGGAAMTIVAAAGFPHVGPLAVTSVSPSAGAASQSVTIHGTGFYGAGAVSFGPYPALSFTVVSDTEIDAVAPASPYHNSPDDHDPLTVDVQVVTLDAPAGSPANPPADAYTFAAPPVLYSIVPTRATTVADTPVVVYGKNLQGVTELQVGPGTSVGPIVVAADGRSLSAVLETSGYTGNSIGTYPVVAFNGADFSAFHNPLFTVYPGGSPPAPPATTLDDALSGRFGVVATRYEFEQRDRANGFIADLTPAVLQDTSGCVIHLDNTQAVTRTVDLIFGQPELLPASFDPAQLDTFNVAVFAVVPTAAGEVRLQRGLFGLDRPDVYEMANGHTRWEVKGSDNGLVLSAESSPVPYVVHAGASYVNTVGAICAGFGLPESVSALAGAGVSYTVPLDLTWEAGTSFLQIVNDLLRGINCFPVYAETDGTMTSRFRLDPSTEAPAIHYRTDQEPRMLVSPSKRTQVVAGVYNQVSVAVDDPSRVPYTAVRTNIDPDSPVSTTRAPLNFLAVTGGAQDGSKCIQSNAMADTVADYLVRDQACHARPREITTQPDPRRTAHEWYLLTIESYETAALYRVVKWDEACFPGGQHVHELEFAQSIGVSA